MSTGFGQPMFGGGLSHSNRLFPIMALEEFTSFSHPTSTSSISNQKHPTTEIEETKAIVTSLMKMEQIIAN